MQPHREPKRESMTVSRSLRVGAVLLTFTSSADAQIIGLPGPPTPWQTGIGYFTGPYFANAQQQGAGVFCVDLTNSLPYGYPWSAFLASSGNNAAPAGYSSSWLGAACLAPGQSDPNAFPSIAGLPGSGPPSADPRFGILVDPGSTPPANTSTGGAAWQNVNWIARVPPPPNNNPGGPTTPPELEPHITPEPSTWLLLGTGLMGVFGFIAIRSTRA